LLKLWSVSSVVHNVYSVSGVDILYTIVATEAGGSRQFGAEGSEASAWRLWSTRCWCAAVFY